MKDAKEFLEQCVILNKKINVKQNELDMLNSMLFKITPSLNPDKVKSSKDKDPLGATVAKVIDVQEEINSMIDEYVDRLKDIGDVIEQVDSFKQYELLHRRYVLGESLQEIADEWGSTYRWVQKVKNAAINSVQKILDENTN